MTSRRIEGVMQLNVANIVYTYPAAVDPALRGVTATFPRGWSGIVGDNGSGKTTLALVACGILQPDAGIVSPRLLALYCAQDATEPPGNLDDFALSYDGTAMRLRHDLGIDDGWLWRYGTLSSGQQKRIQSSNYKSSQTKLTQFFLLFRYFSCAFIFCFSPGRRNNQNESGYKQQHTC